MAIQGHRRKPTSFLQLSLFLLVVGPSLYLWTLKRIAAWAITASIILGAVFYAGIVFVGSLSYDCPFQTPLSLIFWYLSRPTERLKPSLSTGCVFWVLNHIMDPGVITAAVRHLTNLKWHYDPSEKVPLPQVSRSYMKCFSVGYRLTPEYRNTTHTAGRALIHLYVHRLCSDRGRDRNHQDVIDALDHLSGTQYDSTL